MAKPSGETDVTVPRSRKEEQTKTSFSRVVGSKWHYALVLVFAALMSVGIWARPDWAASAVNLVMILGLALSGLAMCYALTRVSKNRMLALMVAVFYMASPYLLENFYNRMSLAEGVVMIAAPILLLGLYQLTTREKHATRYLAVAVAMILLSQSVLAAMFIAMAVVYVLLNVDKVFNARSIWRMILAVVVTLGLTAFFTVPLVETWLGESEILSQEYVEEYLGGPVVSAQAMDERRVRPQELVNLDYANGGGVALGAMALIGVIGFWFAWRTIEEKSERRFVTSLYIIGVMAALLALPLVEWGGLPSVLWRIQDPARFLMMATVALSIVAGYTVFALVRRMSAEKQAVFATTMGVIAVALAARMIMPGGEGYLENVSVTEGTLDGIVTWGREMWRVVREMLAGGYDFTQPLQIALVVSVAMAGLGVVWMAATGVYDLYKRRKQKEVNNLIDSVWEAMAENEGLQEKGEKSKPKRASATKQNERILPEPPAPDVPGIMSTERPAKKSTRARSTSTKGSTKKTGVKKAEEAEVKTDVDKLTEKKPAARKATVRTKSTKAEEPDEEENVKPRVTKVKAGAKKEV